MSEGHEHEKKKDEKISFEISKVRLWQGISLVLAIVVVFMWFSGSGNSPGAANVPVPTQQQQAPQQQQPQEAARVNVDLDDDPVLGKKDAPITIVEFGDYQCPFCGRAFQQTFPQIKKDYIDTGKAKYVFRDFPLSFHPNAQPAAEASECAHEQGKFWEFHDTLFTNQESLGKDFYLKLAGDLKLDVAKFTQCIDSNKYKQEVEDDFNAGSQYGVSGTPSFFINGVRLVGAQPYAAFKQVIDQELAGKK